MVEEPESEVTTIENDAQNPIDQDELIDSIRERLLLHLHSLGVNGAKRKFETKDAIRLAHQPQREEYRSKERVFVEKYGLKLLNQHFADGHEVIPENVRPVITEVSGDGEDARLFRLATLLWSVPVSRGFGRRMRFLVRDSANGRLMGIFALCDPVFNLNARDKWIGWNAEDRRSRLINVMDAFVVGAVPPYSQLIGGKVVASLMTSQDVCDLFAQKYNSQIGIISKRANAPQLALLTVTSALGHSSLYNRLTLSGLVDFKRIGTTQGWGHFHVPDSIFADMRKLLQAQGHLYANGHQYGQGPNWRMRVVRVALNKLGMEQDLLRHGIVREVYAAPLALNWREHLLGEDDTCLLKRPSASQIGDKAVERWLIPRAKSRPEYRTWTQEQTWDLMWPNADSAYS